MFTKLSTSDQFKIVVSHGTLELAWFFPDLIQECTTLDPTKSALEFPAALQFYKTKQCTVINEKLLLVKSFGFSDFGLPTE